MASEKYCFETLDRNVAVLQNKALHWNETAQTFLICGESGTGKTALCRWLAEQAGVNGKTWQEINLNALDESTCEQELLRKFELARQGTAIVEDIGGLNLGLQAKLFEIAQRSGFSPANLILTSRQSFAELQQDGRLHPLWQAKLQNHFLVLPRLNERVQDIAVLSDFILDELAQGHGRELGFSPEVYHFLCRKSWEGNIWELKNWITRLYFLNENATITALDLTDETVQDSVEIMPTEFNRLYPMSLQELEKQYILHSIAMNKGNKSQTARALQISLKTLRSKLKEYQSALIEK